MNKIFLLGDIHGDWRQIHRIYHQNKEKISQYDNNILILLGDAGLNFFFDKRDTKLKEKLKDFPFTYFVIRGNHEERASICAEKNPSDWHLEQCFYNQVWVENKYPYIKYAMDYPAVYNFSYDINNHKERCIALSLPGAYSIDKEYRLLMGGKGWFPNEQLTPEEMKLGEKLIDTHKFFDLVLSHTCPYTLMPTDLFIPHIDQSRVDNTMERWLEKISREMKYKVWCWGHYHQYREYFRKNQEPSYKEPYHLMLNDKKIINLVDLLKNKK